MQFLAHTSKNLWDQCPVYAMLLLKPEEKPKYLMYLLYQSFVNILTATSQLINTSWSFSRHYFIFSQWFELVVTIHLQRMTLYTDERQNLYGLH